MARKPSLASALNGVTGKAQAKIEESKQQTEKTVVTQAEKSNVPPSRQGKKAITGFFDPVVSTQLKRVGLDEDKTVQDLVAEALNDLFIKYGYKPIA